jgi:hypothetical protein
MECSIPPLSSLRPREFQFIDDMAKTDSEQRCQRGPPKYKDKRWPSRKMYSDMKFLCNYIEWMASKAGADASDRSLENVRKIFNAAAKYLVTPGDRNQRMDELKWRTMVGRIRKRLAVRQVEEAAG